MTETAKNVIKYSIFTIIILLGIVGIWQWYDTGRIPLFQTALGDCTGGGVYSIQSVNLQYNNQTGKQTAVIDVIANGGGECARLNLDVADVNNKLTDKTYVATKESILDVSAKLIQIDYNLNYDNSKVSNTINNKEIVQPFYNLVDCSANNVMSKYSINGDYVYSFSNGLNVFSGNSKCTVWYLPYTSQYVFGTISSSGSIYTETYVTVSGYGSTTLNSRDKIATIGDKIKIQYIGTIEGEITTPNPSSNYDVVKKVNEIYIVDKNAYNTLMNYYNTQEKAFLDIGQIYGFNAYTEGVSLANTYQIQFNNKLYDLTSNKINNMIFTEGFKLASTSALTTGHILHTELNTYSKFPLIRIYADAEVLGIKKISGTPDIITCQPSVQFNSNEQKSVSFSVKNIANYGGRFSFSLKCDGITQNINLASDFYNIGEQKTVLGFVTDNSETKITKTCTFTVTDLGFGGSDSCIFGMTIIPKINECDYNGQTACASDGKSILTCNNNVYTKSSCVYGCDYSTGNAKCRSIKSEICDNKVDDDNDNQIDCADPDCADASVCKGECKAIVSIPKLFGKDITIIPNLSNECLKIGWLTWVFLIISLIGGIIIFGLSNKLYKNKFFGFPKKGNTIIILAIITALLITILSYVILQTLWWLFLIIAIAGGILFLVLKISRIL